MKHDEGTHGGWEEHDGMDEIKVGDRDPESSRAHHRGDWLCAERNGLHHCTRREGHDGQHVAMSMETGRAQAVWE